ncbi:MAG: sugar-binding protein [Eubacteriales bacterium]|nr:sugar-binding protein [Eubacteriales bacterium]
MDGIKEAAWDSAESIDIKAWGGGLEGFDVSAADPGDGSMRDCIGFCMDFDYIRTENNVYHDNPSNSGYVNFGADGESYFKYGLAAPEFENATTYKVVLTDKGYDVEVAFSIVCNEIKEGSKIGIEFFINDAVGEGTRYTYANWEGNVGVESWRRTDTMGTLIFGAPAAPQVPEVTDTADLPEAAAPELAEDAPAVTPGAPATADYAIISLGLVAIGITGRAMVRRKK